MNWYPGKTPRHSQHVNRDIQTVLNRKFTLSQIFEGKHLESESQLKRLEAELDASKKIAPSLRDPHIQFSAYNDLECEFGPYGPFAPNVTWFISQDFAETFENLFGEAGDGEWYNSNYEIHAWLVKQGVCPQEETDDIKWDHESAAVSYYFRTEDAAREFCYKVNDAITEALRSRG